MKKISKLIFAVLLIAATCLANVTAFADAGQTDGNEGIMPCLEHVYTSSLSFKATAQGGEVSVNYTGSSTFARADVTVKIEKRHLIVLWREVYTFSASSTDVNGSIYRLCPLDGSGSYKATITLTITSTGGATDSTTETFKSEY